MKKLIALLTMLSASVFADAPATMTVSTNSLILVPKKPVAYTSWTTNTVVAQGAVVRNDGLYYFAVDGGTTTNAAPTHTSGDVEASPGGITWRQISPNKRNGVVVVSQTSSGSVNLSFGAFAAVPAYGPKLVGDGHFLLFGVEDNYQGEIRAIRSGSVDTVVGIQEF